MTSGRDDVAPELPAGRRAVLYAVRRRGEATVEQVAEQLGITVSGARQHLSALTAAGYVEAAEVPVEGPKRGRRALVYTVTDAADAVFPKAYGELTNELLGYVSDRDPELLDDLFGRRREQRIAAAEPAFARQACTASSSTTARSGRSRSATGRRVRARSTSSAPSCPVRRLNACNTWWPARVAAPTKSATRRLIRGRRAGPRGRRRGRGSTGRGPRSGAWPPARSGAPPATAR